MAEEAGREGDPRISSSTIAERHNSAGETLVQILLAHRDRPIPSLREERPDVSERLDRVYQKMVAKRPDDRYKSMAESIAALESCLQAVTNAPWRAPQNDESFFAVASGSPRSHSMQQDLVQLSNRWCPKR